MGLSTSERQQIRVRVGSVDGILESRYTQLLRWGTSLARGDDGVAKEIVHDLCVQLTLSPPDISSIVNLDAYLYTCLRHVYLSRLARSSREALRLVGIEDCDSVQLAFRTAHFADSLENQNQLRRICAYAVWRKEDSKSFSYFILHFFHGYFHREIAEVACLPIAAIYNKLKSARTELKAHFEEPQKLRFANREKPSEATLQRSLIPSPDLLQELRLLILNAKLSDCLNEEELLSHYQKTKPNPLPCSLLAHIVSCERCLSVVDHHFRRPTLRDRDFLDGIERSQSDRGGENGVSARPTSQAMLDSVRWQSRRIREHRPATLSIAVNGNILASHGVQKEHSVLSARIGRAEDAQFVEVYSEQDIRLALLSVDSAPPDGPEFVVQRIAMSDERWLELRLDFDGLGLSGEVAYFDQALSFSTAYEESGDSLPAAGDSANAQDVAVESTRSAAERSTGRRLLRFLNPIPALGWAVALGCVVGLIGILAYRFANRTPDATAILDRSVEVGDTALAGKVEHRLLNFDETGRDGKPLAQGLIELWREPTAGRYMRRMYDSRNQLIAADWRETDGKEGSWSVKESPALTEEDHQLISSPFWNLDLTSRAFRAIAEKPVQVKASVQGYELTARIRDEHLPQVISATLVIDRGFHPISEILQMRQGLALREVHLVQRSREIEPAISVPDSVFRLDTSDTQNPGVRGPSSMVPLSQLSAAEDVKLAQVEIATLYALNRLGADTGEPIQIERTPAGHVRVTGFISSDSRKRGIVAVLEALPQRRDIELRLESQENVRISGISVPTVPNSSRSFVEVPQAKSPADALLRRHFEAYGWSDNKVDSAVAQFSQSALVHAQSALQHAYALDRLGSQFTPYELRSISSGAQREWSTMVAMHASAVEGELRALRDQLSELGTSASTGGNNREYSLSIKSPAQYAAVGRHLLRQTQAINSSVGRAFAAGPSRDNNLSGEQIIGGIQGSIPLGTAEELMAFAQRLAGSPVQAIPGVRPSEKAGMPYHTTFPK